jgi:hypothetical protein
VEARSAPRSKMGGSGSDRPRRRSGEWAKESCENFELVDWKNGARWHTKKTLSTCLLRVLVRSRRPCLALANFRTWLGCLAELQLSSRTSSTQGGGVPSKSMHDSIVLMRGLWSITIRPDFPASLCFTCCEHKGSQSDVELRRPCRRAHMTINWAVRPKSR